MHQIIAYIKFLWRSQNQHGLHSPFVYDLVTKCFYDKTQFEAYDVLKEYRKELVENHDTISVTDFGAGSRVFKSNLREISAIAKNAGIPKRRAKLLYRLVQHLECKTVIELGTSLGIATAAFALNKNAQVTSIEGCPETARIAQQQFNKFGLNNIQLKIRDFESALSNIVTKNTKADLIYFDGNHKKEPTLQYFSQLLPLAHNDTVFIFDDIHWSTEMEEAWEQIKAHPSVRVSIDTFYLGFVFFRKEQAREHFNIRL